MDVVHHPASDGGEPGTVDHERPHRHDAGREPDDVRRRRTRSSAVGIVRPRRRSARTSASEPATKATCGATTIAASANAPSAGSSVSVGALENARDTNAPAYTAPATASAAKAKTRRAARHCDPSSAANSFAISAGEPKCLPRPARAEVVVDLAEDAPASRAANAVTRELARELVEVTHASTASTAREKARHSRRRAFELRAAPPREAVDAAPAPADAGPAAGEQTVALEPVQRRIDRSLRELERSARAEP